MKHDILIFLLTLVPGWKCILFYLLLALLPAVVLMAFMLWRDHLRPEPPKELFLAFLLGLLSVPLSVLLEKLGIRIWGVSYVDTWTGCLSQAFLGAAIPEEFAKLLLLWVFFKWRRQQDEFMDGIVYAVFIGLAFAAVENVKYIFFALDSGASFALSTGTIRALTAVPGHFIFAVLMGFFFSFYLFLPRKKVLSLALAFAVPVVFHGLYDFFALMEHLSAVWYGVINFAFFLIFFLMSNLGIKAIRLALRIDDLARKSRTR